MNSPYFSPQLFRFLKELKLNNNREWFNKNKERYEKVLRDPSLRFISDAGPKLKAISPYIVADPKPNGGSLFRIYRDIRFSKDKSPYKANVAMRFWHGRAKKGESSPGFYLHIAPASTYLGSGMWQPESLALNKIRIGIVENPDRWKKVLDSKLHLENEGSLKRPPKGFSLDQPYIEDLKRKHFVAGKRFLDTQVSSPKFMDEFVEACWSINPLNKFLAEAVGLPW